MKVLVLTLFCLVCVLPAFGQSSTTVSATITDSGGQGWIRGTYSFTFKVSPSNPTGPYFWNGAPFSTSQTIQGDLDGSAHFSVSVPSNTAISPAQSTWVLTVCSIARGNSPCFTTQGLTITGTTQDLTSAVIPPAISIDLTHVAFPFVTAYRSSEITTATYAGLFWNFTLSHYFYCGAISPTGVDQTYGNCTLWVELCQVGDGLCGGAGTSESFQHNGTLVGTQPTFNVIDTGTVVATMTNDIANNRVNVSFTAASGSGCTLPGHDRGVLSEHPAGTCFDSAHWTWNDDSGKQLYQIGNGTNTLSPNASMAFLQGGNITVSGDTAGNIFGLMDFGGSSIVTQTGAGSLIQDAVHIGGTVTGTAQNRITATNGGFVLDVMCLMQGCTDDGLTHRGIVATGAGGNADTNINEVFSVGVSNMVTADSLGNTSSTFLIAEQSTISSANGCNNSDNFILGEFHTLACISVSGADLNSNTILGFNHTMSANSHRLQNVFLLGNTNTAVQNSTTDSTDVGLIGKNLTAANCSDYYALGENINTCANSSIKIGFSNPAELIITPGNVNIKAIPAAPTLCNLGGNISGIGAATPQVIITCAATAPASGCPCRAFVSWTILGGGTSSTQQVEGIISDGTSNFAGTAGNIDNQITTGFKGVARSDYSPNLYSNSQAATFTLTAESDHTWSAVTASFYLGAPTQVRVTYLTSN